MPRAGARGPRAAWAGRHCRARDRARLPTTALLFFSSFAGRVGDADALVAHFRQRDRRRPLMRPRRVRARRAATFLAALALLASTAHAAAGDAGAPTSSLAPPPPNGGGCAVAEWPLLDSLAGAGKGAPTKTLTLELLLTGASLCPFCARPQAAAATVVSNTVQTVPHAVELRSVGQVAVKLAPGATAPPPTVTLADLALIDVPVEAPRGGKGGGGRPAGRRLLAAGPSPPGPSPAPGPSPPARLPPCDVPAGFVYTVSGAQHVAVNLTLTVPAANATAASQMLQSAADGGAMATALTGAGMPVDRVQILLLRDAAAGGAPADAVLGGAPVSLPPLPPPLPPSAAASALAPPPAAGGVPGGAIAGILVAAVGGTAAVVAAVYWASTRGRGADGDDDPDLDAVKAAVAGGGGGGGAAAAAAAARLDRDPALRLLNEQARTGADPLPRGASTDDSARLLRGAPSGTPSDGGAVERAGSGAVHSLWQVNWRDLEIVRQIGEGSFGKVYLAKWRETTVAVKVLISTSLANAGAGDDDDAPPPGPNPLLAGLQQEAAMMASMRHPNVVMYLGVCTDPPLVVTEYCARGSLCDVLKRAGHSPATAAALDWPRRLAMALDAAKGMTYLHSSDPPVIHRDLKSPNLLVDRHWRVKVCDFNLSRVLEESAVVSSLAASNPRWLAPEILSGRGYTFSSDVYSFGVIMWELLTWRLPWSECGPWQVVKQVTDDRARPGVPADPASLPACGPDGATSFPGLPDYLALMRDCWTHDPAARPKFGEVASRLRALLLAETRRADAARRGVGAGGRPPPSPGDPAGES